MKWRFAAKFLLMFALMLIVWWRFDVANRYRGVVLAMGQLMSPLVSGWWLDYDRPGLTDSVMFRRGNRNLPMLLELRALSMGLMPFLSLVVATPGVRWTRAGIAAIGGATLYLLAHVIVVLAYPLIMDRPNAVKNTLGVFSGLVTFVAAPLGLWFVLTYPALRSIWQIGPQQASKPPVKRSIARLSGKGRSAVGHGIARREGSSGFGVGNRRG